MIQPIYFMQWFAAKLYEIVQFKICWQSHFRINALKTLLLPILCIKDNGLVAK